MRLKESNVAIIGTRNAGPRGLKGYVPLTMMLAARVYRRLI